MPFGLKNARATYQSKTEHDWIQDVEETLLTLKKVNMKLNPKKCLFGMKDGKFLGYIVTSKGIRVNPEKTKAVMSMPSPSNLKQMQSLKSVEEALQAMKRLIVELPTPTPPMKDKELMVYLSTADEAVSAVLLVERKVRHMPIHYVSRSLQGAEVITDKPINQILNSPKASGRLAKCAIELGAYGISYALRNIIKGQVLADFLADMVAGDDPTCKKAPSIETTLALEDVQDSSKVIEERTEPDPAAEDSFHDVQNCLKSTKEEFAHFLELYPIPSEYSVMLPKRNQTIFDAIDGYVGHLTSVRVFLDPILFMPGLKPSWEHEMDFRNFMYAKTDEDIYFLPKEPSPDFGTGSSSVLINTEPPISNVEPVVQLVENMADSRDSQHQGEFVIHPGSVVARIKDRKYKMRGASSRPPIKCGYDNAINKRSWDLLKVIEQIRGGCDLMKERERAKNEECEGLKANKAKEHKANLDRMMLESKKWAGYQVSLSTLESKVASLKAEKARLEAVEASLPQEVNDLKRDRIEVVSKVVPYIAMELVHNDELGRLVGKIVSSAVFYGRCAAFEEVAEMKEPFNLTKVKGYRPSYKKEHTKAGNDLATATFPFLYEVVADPSTLIKTFLSKKPPTLQRPTPSRTQAPIPSSQKATPSSAPLSKPMSPPAVVSSVKVQSPPA
ncbi:hypothetical protein Tco_1100547 [Tanacetum coccineum]